AIVESSDDAIISKTLDGVIVSWNRGAERLYGYLADEIIGQPITRLIPPGHPDELPHLIDRLKRGERIEHFETQRVCKDGRCLNVSLTISPIKDDEGKIVGASKIARDITAQKRRETGLTFLAESGKLLSELLDVPSTLNRVAQLAVPKFADWCSVDLLEGDQQLVRVAVAHADPAKVELAEELRKKYPPDPHAPVGAWSVIRMGRSELVADIPDSLLAQAIRDPELLGVIRRLGLRSYIGVPLIVSGRTMGVITFIAAESGHRYDRADLQIAEELAQRAAIAIENARLYNEVKQASRRKDEFLAMLGHELRNPLAPIRSALQIMNTPNVGEAALAEARQVTQRQVQHLARLVDDLLDVSRIMRGHIELRRQPVSLQTVLSHAIETVQPLVNERKQQLIVDMPSKPVMLEADATRLTQAIGNLLNNASKFSSSPGRFWLTAKLDGGEAVISVRDEGIGIPRETLPYIFDLFVQGDQSLERTEGGLGIGLTVVRKLIEMHGGRIMADSRGPGQGSEFVIHLPTVQAPTSPRPEKPRDPAADAKRRRVLVVDDSVDAAKTIAMLLRLWGHDVKTAHDGAEALAIAHDFLPEVVLLDIGLPGMNGYELARRMRSEPPLAKVRLVAVSGYGQQEDLRRSKEAGFDQHFTKPVEPAALERLLRETDPPRNGN
ncbi:MAG TPA: PAS domain S-box protein, partial [Pirellulales bacterium]|nr:PAS domain S-box protein [Pirellulales bacterium]